MIEVRESEDGIIIGKGITAKKVSWEELGDLISTLEHYHLDHSSENLEHEYQSL